MSAIFYMINSALGSVLQFNLHLRDYLLLTAWLVPTVFYYKYLNRKTRKAWSEMAKILGLKLQDRWQKFQLVGDYEKAPVLVIGERRKSLESWSLRVQRTSPHPVRFTVRARSLKAPIQMNTTGRLILTGDDSFDGEIRIQGEEETAVIAVFSSEIRRRVRALIVGTSTAITPEGADFFETETKVVKQSAQVAKQIQEALGLLTVMQVGGPELVTRLITNLKEDPNAFVRLNCVSLLHKRFPKAENVSAAMRGAMADSDPLIRLRAALYLNEGNLKGRIQDVVTVKSKPYNAGVLADIMDLLAARKDPVVEPALFQWLDSEASSVKLKAVETLGKIGTPQAVGRLRAMEKVILSASDLKTAVRKSIEQIQARVDPSARGSLSLSELQGSEGALSLTHEGGELSLEEKPSTPPLKPQPDSAGPDIK